MGGRAELVSGAWSLVPPFRRAGVGCEVVLVGYGRRLGYGIV